MTAMHMTNRFDSIVAQAATEGRPELGTYGEHFLKHVVLAGDGQRLDDDEAYTYSRALETIWAKEIESPRAPLPLAQGDLLPDSPSVEEGSATYIYFLISDQGDAQWSASMTGTEMPTTSLSGAEMTGRIQTIEGGYVVSRKQLRNAKKGRVRLLPRSQQASLRAHLELWDEGLAWGRESIGILGLFNHPLISFITAAPVGAGNSTFWRDKTLDQIAADMAALINSVPRQTNELMHVTRVLMSPRLFDYCQQTRMGGDNMSLTILQHLERVFSGAPDDNVTAPEHPVKFSTVRYLDATNARAQGELTSDALFAYIDNDPDVVSRVSGFIARAYPTQERGVMLETPQESEVGGVEVAQPLCLVRMNAVFNG